MSVQQVKEYFASHGMDGRVMEFSRSSATVAEAALAVGCEGARIAKTLSFDLQGDTILIVAAGDARIDNKKYRGTFGAKAKMLPPEDTEERTGHAVGGICPFAVKDGVRVYLDDSLRRFETVFPACGSSNSAVELTIPELEKLSCAVQWIDVCKDWQQ